MGQALLKNNGRTYLAVALCGLLAGVLTRLTDFCEGESLWGFHAVATLYGFWIISVTAIVLLSDTGLCAGACSFLYLFAMTVSFYGLRYFLDAWVFRYEDARFQSSLFLVYTVLSAVCGAGAFALHLWGRGGKLASVLYGLPVGALLAEALGVALFMAAHGTYLFQLVMDLAGAACFGVLFHRRAPSKALYYGSVCLVGAAVYAAVYRPFL